MNSVVALEMERMIELKLQSKRQTLLMLYWDGVKTDLMGKQSIHTNTITIFHQNLNADK